MQLSDSDVAFVQHFRPTLEIPLEAGKTLLCFHGSPRSFDDIILPRTPDEVVRQFLGGYDATLFAGGPTHTQQLRRLGTSWYFNPGSVSLAYNWELSDPWADYAIVTSEGACLGITFRHVPFDVNELARMIRASGRPYAEEAMPLYLHEKREASHCATSLSVAFPIVTKKVCTYRRKQAEQIRGEHTFW